MASPQAADPIISAAYASGIFVPGEQESIRRHACIGHVRSPDMVSNGFTNMQNTYFSVVVRKGDGYIAWTPISELDKVYDNCVVHCLETHLPELSIPPIPRVTGVGTKTELLVSSDLPTSISVDAQFFLDGKPVSALRPYGQSILIEWPFAEALQTSRLSFNVVSAQGGMVLIALQLGTVFVRTTPPPSISDAAFDAHTGCLFIQCKHSECGSLRVLADGTPYNHTSAGSDVVKVRVPRRPQQIELHGPGGVTSYTM